MRYLCLSVLLLCVLTLPAQGLDLTQRNAQAEQKLNNNPKQALIEAAKIKAEAEQAGDLPAMDMAVAIMGVANFKIDQYDKATVYIEQAVKQGAQNRDTAGLAFTMYWKGILEMRKGNFPRALYLFQEAGALAERTGDKKILARSIDGKAGLYESLGDNEMADSLYRQSLQIAEAAGFKEWYPTVLFSLGNIAYNRQQTDTAIGIYKEAIQKSEEVNNLNNKANCLQKLATVYYDKNELKTAMKYIQQAMDIFEQTGSGVSFSYGRLLMAAILLKDRLYTEAINLAEQSLQDGKKQNELGLQGDAAEILYYAYLGRRDYPKALDYHVLFHRMAEQQHTADLSKELAKSELQSNFEKEREMQKAREAAQVAEINARLEQQQIIKRTTMVGIVLIAIIAGLAIFAFIQKRRDTRLIASEKRKSDEILQRVLPAEIIEELKKQKDAGHAGITTVLFADIKNAGGIRVTPDKLQASVDFYFKEFDDILKKYHIERIKSDNDTFLCASRPSVLQKETAVNTINAALEMRSAVERINAEVLAPNGILLDISTGIHTGPLAAGIVGLRKTSHDIWSETINTAARMEQHSVEGKINISGSTYELVKNRFTCTPHGKIDPGTGSAISMYFVEPGVA